MSESRNLVIWTELMKTPHKDLQGALEAHRRARDENPLFYVKLAAWYQDRGDVRDHKVAFVRCLFEAEQIQLREAGWALLQDLPFHLVDQVVMDKNSRSLRGAVIHYLSNMNEGEMANAVLRNAKALKRLVRRLHIPTTKSSSEGLRIIGRELFSKQPVVRKVFKDLENAKTSEEVSDILHKTRIPAYVAVSAIKVRTPEIMRALIQNMTVNEMLQSMNTLGRLGAIKPNMDMIRSKLQRALDDRRINLGRIRSIEKNLDKTLVPLEIFDNLVQMVQERAKKETQIKKTVSIHVDGSGSMEHALKAAQQLSVALGMASTQPPTMFVTSTTPTEVIPSSWIYSGVESAMSLVRAQGGTPLGAGIKIMAQKYAVDPDIIVLITDTAENAPPFFAQEYLKLKTAPEVLIIKVPGEPGGALQERLKTAEIPYQQINIDTFEVDQYAIDQIVQLVGTGSPMETIIEIMNVPVPIRPEETKHDHYWERVG